jgi:hypothetical protein
VILIRRAAGHDIGEIANQIGMKADRVESYMRFRDQVDVAEAAPKRPKVVV